MVRGVFPTTPVSPDLSGSPNSSGTGFGFSTTGAGVSSGKTPTRRGRERNWSEWQDSNLRPPRPERGALPD